MKRLFFAVCVTLTVLCASSARADILYSDFSSTTGLNLQGSAAQSGNVLRLTPAVGWMNASAWYSTQQSVSSGFTTTFQFQITDQGNGGADGFAFLIQNQGATATGTPGGEMGYQGITNSLAIEFDTWHNTEFPDPNDNHISIQPYGIADHTYSLGCASNITNLSDGNVHTATIGYSNNALSIALDGTTVLSEPLNLADYVTLNNGQAWVGFTSATGGAWENHDVLSWSVTAVPEPGTLALLATGLLTYAWRKRRQAA